MQELLETDYLAEAAIVVCKAVGVGVLEKPVAAVDLSLVAVVLILVGSEARPVLQTVGRAGFGEVVAVPSLEDRTVQLSWEVVPRNQTVVHC